jgi:hypothetical protein
VTLVLDTGALLAFDRGDRTVRALLERAARTGVDAVTTSGAVAQAWHGGGRQARLALLLKGVLEVELTRRRSRSVGVLLGQAGGRDVVDASIVDAAHDGDEILTSDPDDIVLLAHRSGKTLVITPV